MVTRSVAGRGECFEACAFSANVETEGLAPNICSPSVGYFSFPCRCLLRNDKLYQYDYKQ